MPLDHPQTEQASDPQTGWVKPQRRRTLAELQALIGQKRAELKVLEDEASKLQREARLQAIAQARNIMRAHQLTIADVVRNL